MKTSLAIIGDFLPPHYSYRAERVNSAPAHNPRKLLLNKQPLAEIGRKPKLQPLKHTSKRAAKGKTRVIRPQNWGVRGSF
jgi:hypothetical protein